MAFNPSDAFRDEYPLRLLFAPGERWGWEWRDVNQLYVPFPVEPPKGPTPPPLAQFANDPNDPHVVKQRWDGRRKLIAALLFVGGVVIGAGSNAGAYLVLLIWAVGFPWLALRTRAINRRASDAGLAGKAAWDARWAQQSKEHEAAVAEWQRRAAEHHATEQHRLAQLPEWGAARPRTVTRRIDLCGGTPAGWQRLVTTLGASLLGSGERLFLLDLSEADVAALLFKIAPHAGVAVRAHVLPGDMEHLDVFGGLGPTAVKDAIVEAVHAGRSEVDRAARSLDDRILTAVCEVLAPTITFDRISSALRVLLRDEPPPSGDDGPLTGDEWGRLSDLFNAEYRGVIGSALVALDSQLSPLRSLGRQASTAVPSEDDVRCEAVAVDRTGGAVLNEMLVDVLVQATIARLRGDAGDPADQSRVIIVIGADVLKRRHLEKLDDLADALGTRVIYLFRHLREDVLDVAGAGGAVAGIMRPGNSREAEQAANVIGRGYKFVLNQMTSTSGVSDTTSWGASQSRTWGNMSSSTTEGENQGQSTGTTEQSGLTQQRVHEYEVEPEPLRALPPTALLLVEFSPTGQQRRVRVVDCDPALVTRPRVSALPFAEQIEGLGAGHPA